MIRSRGWQQETLLMLSGRSTPSGWRWICRFYIRWRGVPTALILSRVRLKDVDVKVASMKAEVEEMTRDRRNNILLHGLPYQVHPPLRHIHSLLYQVHHLLHHIHPPLHKVHPPSWSPLPSASSLIVSLTKCILLYTIYILFYTRYIILYTIYILHYTRYIYFLILRLPGASSFMVSFTPGTVHPHLLSPSQSSSCFIVSFTKSILFLGHLYQVFPPSWSPLPGTSSVIPGTSSFIVSLYKVHPPSWSALPGTSSVISGTSSFIVSTYEVHPPSWSPLPGTSFFIPGSHFIKI